MPDTAAAAALPVAALRQLLPSPEREEHWAAGRAMSLEQAIDDALSSAEFEQQERLGGRSHDIQAGFHQLSD